MPLPSRSDWGAAPRQAALEATLADMQAMVDEKAAELAESAHRNVQLGARVRPRRICQALLTHRLAIEKSLQLISE